MDALLRQSSRRRLLGLLSAFGVGGLAGCFSPRMGGSVSRIAVFNGTDRSVTVSLDVYRLPSERRVVGDTFELGPEEEEGTITNGRSPKTAASVSR